MSHAKKFIPTEDEVIAKELKKYNIADAKIAELSKMYMPLELKDLDDKETFKAIREGRIHIKGVRVDVEKKRKELKAFALKYGKAVDGEAKRLTSMLYEIENHLHTQEDKVRVEKERIEREERERKEKIGFDRIGKLTEQGVMATLGDVIDLEDGEFEETLKEAKEIKRLKDEEAARIEAARKAEEERLRVQKEEQDKQARELAEQRAEIERQRKEVEEQKQAQENERLEREREEQKKKEIQEAEEKAREYAAREERKKVEAENERLRLQELEQERQKQLAPDKDKIDALIADIKAMELPQLKNENAVKIIGNTRKLLDKVCVYLDEQKERL